MLIVKSQLVFILSDPTSSSVPTTEMFKLVILLLLFGLKKSQSPFVRSFG